jgi:hypothetical protein
MSNKPDKSWFKRARQQKALYFLVFWLVALLLWFVSGLGSRYTHTFTLRVRAESINDYNRITADSVRTMRIEVHGRGIDLIRQFRKLKSSTLVVQAGKYRDSSLVKIEDYRSQIIGLFPTTIRIQNLGVDTFHFSSEYLFNRLIPVKPNFALHFERGFGKTGAIRILPDSIRVFSSNPEESFPDDLDLEYVSLQRLNRTWKGNVRIDIPEEANWFVKRTKAQVEIPIQRITEGKFRIPVKLVNAPPKIRLIPSTIEVSYTAGLSYFKRIEKSDFYCVADWAKRTTQGAIPIDISPLSPWILTINTYPASLDYIEQ